MANAPYSPASTIQVDTGTNFPTTSFPAQWQRQSSADMAPLQGVDLDMVIGANAMQANADHDNGELRFQPASADVDR